MKYGYNNLARTYVRGFYTFIVEQTDLKNRSEAYVLFRYSLKSLFNMEISEVNEAVLKYGEKCVNYLKNLNGTPKSMDNISFEERVHLFDYCDVYLVTLNLLFWEERQGCN